MGTITGSNGNDTLLGTISSDIINSGNGDDIVNGGAGSDQINGGAGNDTLIYTVSENQGGFKDVYTGGSGIDTVRLQLSSAEWNDSTVRAELERYVKFLSTVKMNPQGEVSNGSASDFVFNFGTSTLTVQMMEKLAVWVKPEFGGDYAQVDYLKSLITGDIAGTAVEAGGVGNADKGVSIVSGQLKSDDLDGADNLFRSVDTGIEAKYGTYTISANGLWHYTLNNADSRVQELKANEILKDTFSVSSADGAVKVITITIVGSNDAPEVSAALSDSAEEGGAAFAMNLLTGASDADHGETAGLDVTALNYSVDGVPASGIPAGLSLTGSMLSVDPTDHEFDHLAVGEHTTIVVSYNVRDAQGATVAQHATITISGTNDVPVVTGALTFGEDESEESYSLNLLAGASDVDHGETASLSVADVTYSVDGNAPSGSAPSGVALAGNNLNVDPSNGAFNHLAVGEKTTIVVSYNVKDVHGAAVAQVATITIHGTNDTPVVSTALSSTAAEGAGGYTMNLLDGASDSDDGETASLSISNVGYSVDGGVVASTAPDGVSLAGSTLSVNPANGAFNHLAVGAHATIVVTYNVKDAQGATVAQSATIIIEGTNDAPVVTGAVTGSASEDGDVVALNALANASDVDDGTTFTVVSMPAALPAGVNYDAATHTFTLNPGDSAYQSLAAGQKAEVAINYGVSDGTVTVPALVKFTVTGTNDAPVVTGAVMDSATEDGVTVTINALANASDVDQGTTLSVVEVPAPLPPGVSYDVDSHSFTLDPSDVAYQSLAHGQTMDVTISYGVTDGKATVPASVTFTVTGTNDAPVVTGAVMDSATEDGVTVTINALANASDVDQGTTLSVVEVPDSLPAGVSYDVDSHSFTLDPSDAAYQSLAHGQAMEVTVSYGVSDGKATVPASVKFTVTGTNDAPVVTGAVMDAATEDGAEVTINALANASDVDQGTTLSVVAVPDPLPAGVSYNVDSHSFTLDPSDAAYQSLAHGQAMEVTISYGVTDGKATVPASVKFTVTGTNDAPVVTGAVMDAATEDGAAVTINALANASDVDQGTILSVVAVPDPLPAGVSYNVDSHSFTLDPSDAAYQSLAHGQAMDVTISYGVTDGKATVPASVTFTVTGTNDAPVVTGAVMDSATEDGVTVTINALANASDVDQGTTLSVVEVPDSLPAGVSYDVDSHSFTLDPSDAAYQSLAHGQAMEVTVSYGVSDGKATVPASVKFTVTGTNDAPVVTGAVMDSATEDGVAVTINALANASDVDQGTTLSVVEVPDPLPAGVSYDSDSHSFTLDPSDAAYQSLAHGQAMDVTISYGVTDGKATVPASVTFTVTGTNDAPVVTGAVMDAATEDGAEVTINALANASDVDQGTTLSVVAVPDPLPAGVSYNVDSHSFTLDPSDAAYQSLAHGQAMEVTISYGVTDGKATVPASVTFTVTGTNDAPVVTGAVMDSATEDGVAVTINALANASDVDQGTTLSVVEVPDPLPAGVSYDSDSHSFTLDPSDAAYQSLAYGQAMEVTVSYGVTDGKATVPASVTFTVTGANDAPVVTGAVMDSATEDGAAVTINALANASDVDQGTTLSVVEVPDPLPAGVSYDVDSHSFTLDPSDAAYQSLAHGQAMDVTISYGVTDGKATVPASVTFTVTGTNDAPVVTGAVMDSATEDGAEVTVDALANASDIDQGTTLSVVAVPDSLPAGVSYDADSHSFTLDPSDAAYQNLAYGQAMEVTVSYGVTDGKATVPASVTFTVTGTNDVPVVTGSVMDVATEDGAEVTINALANASDIDQGTTLSVVAVPDPLPAGVSYDVDLHSFTLDPSDAAYQSLAHGQAMAVMISYGVTDGKATVPASVTFTVTGTNDAPVVTGAVMDVATEDGAVVTINALANASDVDQGTTLSVVAVPDSLPAGVSYDPTTHTFALNPGDSAYQSLAAGQTAEVTVNYGVSDGTATVPASVKFTVIGSNDAPVVSAAVNSSKLEGAQSFTMNLLAGASDVDNNETASLAVVDVTYSVDSGLTSSSAPAGVSLTGNTLNVNPANTSFDHLAVGESSIIVVNYSVKDIHGATVAQSATITITGTNDAPVVGAALTSSAAEGAGSYSMSLLAGASDVDHNETATLSVTDVTYRLDNSAASASAPAGISLVGSTLTVDPSNSAFNHLAVGAHATVTVSYNVKDAYGAVAPQSATIVINGTNDTPMVSGTLSSTAAEGAATYTMNLLAGASDADDGETATLSVANVSYSVDGVAVPSTPAGVSLTGGTLSVDPANGSFDHLAAGQSSTIVVSYSVKDAQGASAAQNATITITGTNDAPVLNLAATPVLVNVVEDAGAPSGAVGTLVSSLVNLNPPLGGLDNVTDADSNALTGIALTGTNATNGTWWYSTNGGANWSTVGAVSNATALLLSADANTRVYFQGNLDFNGTVSDGLTFRAWDQSSGTAGTKVSTTTNGGSSAFSSAADTAAITVIADNFAPVPTNDRIIVSSGTNVTISTSALLGNDIDIDGSALTITGVSSASGISNLSLSGNTISFRSGSAAGTSVGSFQYTVSDGRGGTATGTVAIDVKAVTSNSSSGDTVDLSGAGNYQASYIDADNGPDTVTGGAPGDSFYGGSGNAADTLRGGAGNDLLVGEGGNDILSGSSGNDILRGGSGDDAMDGGDGSEDMLDMSDGSALINFTLVQSAGITTTGGAGGLGNDSYQNMEGVIGSSSNDSINGSNGNDIIRGGAGNDTLDGRVGNDLLDLSDGTAGIVFTMGLNGSGAFSAGGLGTDTYTSFEGVIGTAFADTLNGLSAADELRGGAGNDTINGQAGDDRVVGGAGSDTLTGGADNDTFVFDSAPNAVDSITDFNASGSLASGDMVELSLAVFAGITTAPGSVLSSSEFASSVGGGVNDVVAAGVRVIYDSVTGNLYYDADGQGSGGRTLVAKLVLTDPGDTFDYNDIKIGS